MIRTIPASAIICILISINAAAQETNARNPYSELGKARSLLSQQTYQSAVLQGLAALDLIYKNLSEKLAGYIPDLPGYQVRQTNSFYVLHAENGDMDAYLTVNKVYTNLSGGIGHTLTITFDSTLGNVERYYSLARGYEQLQVKGYYRKFVHKQGKTEYHVVWEIGRAWLAIPLNMENGTMTTGLLIQLDVQFAGSLPPWTDREKLFKDLTWQIVQKLPNLRTLGWYLK